MNEEYNFDELVDRHLRGELNDRDREQLATLLDSDPDLRRRFVEDAEWDTALTEALKETPGPLDHGDIVERLKEMNVEEPSSALTFTKALLAIAAVVIVALSVSLFRQRSTENREIATITGISGSILWTGDGGRVVTDLVAGTDLRGGTIEGLAPDSWIDLEFKDGSTITLAGNSVLTFSDLGQKVLHVRGGKISASVTPQPPGRPMLINTRSAQLEVLGTQFKVESEIASTLLSVGEGKVRAKRLSDGATVDVPAQHRLVAAADQPFAPIRVPDSVFQWKSTLSNGPRGTFGKWSPKTEQDEARLAAIPLTLKDGRTIYSSSISLSMGERGPVMLNDSSQFRVRGHITSAHDVFFGVTLQHANGDFAGRFQMITRAEEFEDGKLFELILPTREFRLDPSLRGIKDKLPGSPSDLVVQAVWCHSLYDPAGLEITEVELSTAAKEKFQ